VTALRSIYAVAIADFLERVRRYSFLVTLLFAVCLGYATAKGKISLQLDEHRGVYTSAWIGTLVALVTACFVSFVGFYIVKNSVERDRSTGVGQILAATPLSKLSYAFGKFLSNFAILTAMLAVLALSALAMQFLFAEDPRVDLWALLAPFLLMALPVMALTAAIALLFEMVPVLRGGVGNVVWFFGWTFGIALPAMTGLRWLDPVGIFTVMQSLSAEARRYVPGYHGGMAFQIDSGQIRIAHDLRWPGIPWTWDAILLRLIWFGVAALLALFAALVFDRFDSARAGASAIRKHNGELSPAPAASAASVASPVTAAIHLTPLAPGAHTNSFGRLFAAELRLALKGFRWWWYAIAAGLLVAQIFSPLDLARGPLLATAWFWSVLIWSAMGTRESRFGTRGLLFSSPRILLRQLPACFLAGFAVAALTGSVVGVRLLIAGQQVGLIAWLAGALFLPSLALASGIVSGTGKVFEALLTVLWYIGPMNRTPGFDFTGAANGPLMTHYAFVYAAMSAALLVFAFFTRSRQLRSN
jgi:hypothetical protein